MNKIFYGFIVVASIFSVSSAAYAECRTVYVNGKKTVVCDQKPGPTLLPNPPVRPPPKKCNGCKA